MFVVRGSSATLAYFKDVREDWRACSTVEMCNVCYACWIAFWKTYNKCWVALRDVFWKPPNLISGGVLTSVRLPILLQSWVWLVLWF